LLAGGGRLWLSVTAAVPVEVHDLNAELVGRSDLSLDPPKHCELDGFSAGQRAIRGGMGLHLMGVVPKWQVELTPHAEARVGRVWPFMPRSPGSGR